MRRECLVWVSLLSHHFMSPVTWPRCRVKATLRRTYTTLPQVASQGVCHFLKQEIKGRNNTHFLALALTLTLTCILTRSPNHFTSSNFERPCTLFRLMCTAFSHDPGAGWKPHYVARIHHIATSKVFVTTHAQCMLHPHISREGAWNDVYVLKP